MKTQTIEIKKIVPDKDQPRKFFPADKLAILKTSIKQYGIKQPLTVEDNGNGTYRLVNGERRYRAAMELKLKELPCIIEAPMDDITRLITQFHIQDEHEDWTPSEKANAIHKMAEDFKINSLEVCRLLNIDSRTAAKYMAFAKIIDKKSFNDNEIPITFAENIISVKAAARKSYLKNLGKDLTRQDEKDIEASIIVMIKSGSVHEKYDLVKVKDAVTQDVKSVQRLIDGSATSAEEIFRTSNAKGAYNLRNTLNSARYFCAHGANLIKEDSIKPDSSQMDIIKRVKKMAESLINEYSE